MVFMNAKKKNKTIVIFLVAAISLGLLMSVSVYFMGDYSGSSNVAVNNLPPGSAESKAVQDFQQGMALVQQKKDADAQKKFESARSGFEEVLKKDPNNVQTLGDLATTYFYMNNVDKAIETVKKALEINPDFTTARLNYGVYLAYGKNNTGDAIKELEKVKKGDFNYDKAQQMIGEISKLSTQPLLPPKDNNASSVPAQPDAPPASTDPTTGNSTINEGDPLPPNHPKID